MRPSRIRKPSPALLVACIALCAALVGTAVAGPVEISLNKREKKQTKKIAKKVAKNVSKKQANRQITRRAGNLTVKNALTADSATSATNAINAINAVNANSVRFFEHSMTEGQTQTLFTAGPLSAVAKCEDAAGDTETNILAQTTEANSAFAGDDDGDVFGPETAEADRTFEDPGSTDSAGGTPDVSDGYDDQFWIKAPSGALVAGTVGQISNADTQTCQVFGTYLVR